MHTGVAHRNAHLHELAQTHEQLAQMVEMLRTSDELQKQEDPIRRMELVAEVTFQTLDDFAKKAPNQAAPPPKSKPSKQRLPRKLDL